MAATQRQTVQKSLTGPFKATNNATPPVIFNGKLTRTAGAPAPRSGSSAAAQQ